MPAYSDTSVSVSKSQEAIRNILKKADVRGVTFGEDFETNTINIRFAKNVGGNFHTVSVSMKVPEAPEPKRKQKSRYLYRSHRFVIPKTQEERQDQMTRATYRAMHYWLKSQFEAIDFGLVNFEDVFLSHFEWMMKDGTKGTLGDLLKPQFSAPALEAGEIEDIIEGEVK
jgi:hypothetical protein